MNYPAARTEGLVTQTIDEELLVYDLKFHRAFSLNATAATVFNACDGSSSLAVIAERTGLKEAIVNLALQQLSNDGLVNNVAREAKSSDISRRNALRRLALASAVALPVVASIIAPTAASAASCLSAGLPCTQSAQCCSGNCVVNTCL